MQAPRSAAAHRRSAWARLARPVALAAAMLVAAPLGALAASPAEASPFYRVPTVLTVKVKACAITWVRDRFDGPVKRYRIWVVPQFSAPAPAGGTLAGGGGRYRTIVVAPPAPGTRAGTTVTGLLKGRSYVFWLEAVYTSRSGAELSYQVATTKICTPR